MKRKIHLLSKYKYVRIFRISNLHIFHLRNIELVFFIESKGRKRVIKKLHVSIANSKYEEKPVLRNIDIQSKLCEELFQFCTHAHYNYMNISRIKFATCETYK